MASARAPALAILAAKPAEQGGTQERAATTLDLHKSHSDSEWAAAFPHIQRLYVHERRKLRYVMAHMREKHGFNATPQMYKKRFAKWGFHKNARRSRVVSTSPRSTDPSDPDTPGWTSHTVGGVHQIREISLPQLALKPTMNRPDLIILSFLTSIRSWSTSFLETVRESQQNSVESPPKLSLVLPYKETAKYDQEQISASIRLVADLLVRGQGHLAGRLARKAFLQIEHMLELEGPPFIWNLLEMLHNIIHLKQGRLLNMLIIHLMGLARSHYPGNHAIVQLLEALWHLSESSENGFSHLLPTILEQGWLLNADILFSNFNERFLLLYYRLMWNSGLLRLTQDKLQDADLWFSLVNLRVPTEAIIEGTARLHPALDFAPPDARNLPPANYDGLRENALAEIHEEAQCAPPESTTRFRVLSGILKSRVLDENMTFPETSHKEANEDITGGDINTQNRSKATRLQARVLAYLLDVLIDTDTEKGDREDIIIDRLNNIIPLREYGEGATAPQVILELWRLRDMLVQQSRFTEAVKVEGSMHKRLEQYLGDIPVDSVKEIK